MPINAKTPRRKGNQKEVLCASALWVNNFQRIFPAEKRLESFNAKTLRRKENQKCSTLRLCAFALKLVSKHKGGAMNENAISQIVIKSAIEVHRTLGGPGLLESVYEQALIWELNREGLRIKQQSEIPVVYKGILLPVPLRLDLTVEDLVIVECKATMENHPIFESQLLTYLRITGLHLGMLVNFGFPIVSRGISRVVNKLDEMQLRR
ncbi:MAG: GxxExxY protein [Anaerolineales bacterium]